MRFGAYILTALFIVSCGELSPSIPSCGDVNVTKTLNETLIGIFSKNTGVLENEFKSRITLKIIQPVIVSHNSELDSYSCKAIVEYSAPAVIKETFTGNTNELSDRVVRKYRELYNSYTYVDILLLSAEIDSLTNDGVSESDPKFKMVWGKLANALGLPSNATNLDLSIAISNIPSGGDPERQAAADSQFGLFSAGFKMTEKTNTTQFPVEYTIAKIDDAKSQNQFQLEAIVANEIVSEIQALEVMASAALIVRGETVNNNPAATSNKEIVAPTDPITTLNNSLVAPEKADPIESRESIATTPVPETKVAGTPISPSFDCANASTNVEHMICSSEELAAADIKLMQTYKKLLNNTGNKEGLKRWQNDWLKSIRDACSEANCILKAYNDRIVELSEN